MCVCCDVDHDVHVCVAVWCCAVLLIMLSRCEGEGVGDVRKAPSDVTRLSRNSLPENANCMGARLISQNTKIRACRGNQASRDKTGAMCGLRRGIYDN